MHAALYRLISLQISANTVRCTFNSGIHNNQYVCAIICGNPSLLSLFLAPSPIFLLWLSEMQAVFPVSHSLFCFASHSHCIISSVYRIPKAETKRTPDADAAILGPAGSCPHWTGACHDFCKHSAIAVDRKTTWHATCRHVRYLPSLSPFPHSSLCSSHLWFQLTYVNKTSTTFYVFFALNYWTAEGVIERGRRGRTALWFRLPIRVGDFDLVTS